MFDINTILDAASADIEIKHPVTGEALGATVTLAGPEHPTRKALAFSVQRKLRQAIQKTGTFEFADPAEDELDAIERLARCTLGWVGIAEDGKPIEFSTAAAAKLYAADGMGWLRAQLYSALEERERFIKACAAN